MWYNVTGNRPCVYPLKALERKITWNHGWISPYESLWGIFEKFKFANCATVKDIYRLYGTDYVKNLKSQTIGRPHRDCIRPSGLDHDLIKSAFTQSLLQINERNIDRLIGVLPSRPRNRYSYIRNELFFCPECMKSGFHSLFHQFKLLHECPYHQIPLGKGCPNCKKTHAFELTDETTQEPFRCLCGYSFLDTIVEKSNLPNWKQMSLNELKSQKIKDWLNLNNEEIERLKYLHFPLNLDLEEYPHFLDYIFSTLNRGNPSVCNETHRVVKSTPHIRLLIGDREKEERKLPYTKELTKLYDDIYHSSVQTVQSIASHIRKTFLKKHKSCFQRLMKSSLITEPICPYALAYGHWLKFVLEYESIWTLRRAYPYRKYPGRLEFGSKYDDPYISNLYESLKFSVDEGITENRAAIKWIVNRIMGHLLWNHFMNWLSISQEAAINRLEYRRFPFGIKEISFYILIIPKNKNEPLEFHWWSKQEPCQIHLQCVFDDDVNVRRQ
jgi:hypothetical protein